MTPLTDHRRHDRRRRGRGGRALGRRQRCPSPGGRPPPRAPLRCAPSAAPPNTGSGTRPSPRPVLSCRPGCPSTAGWASPTTSPAPSKPCWRPLRLSRLNPLGLNNAAAALFSHGSEEQRLRFLPPIVRNEEKWCQLFSEPGAGSDLASLATRAVRDGDDWVISGQKVWTTWADEADFAILLGPHGSRGSPNTRASPTSCSTCISPASRCDRCARSPGRPSSTKCSSTVRASPTPTGWATSTTDGGSARRRCPVSGRWFRVRARAAWAGWAAPVPSD